MPRNTKPEDGLAIGLTLILALALALAFFAGCGVGKATAHPMTQAKPLCGSLQDCRDDLARARQGLRWHRSVKLHRLEPTVSYAFALCRAIYGPRCAENLIRRIGRCESGLAPWAKNRTSSAGGVMQYLDTTWRTTTFGRTGFSRFDPIASILAAARHFASGGSTSPWYASRGCWG